MNKGWKYCRLDISPTVEKMTETKCKMEEDHRIFAERPCSYGYLFWCTGIHKQTYQLLVFLVLNQRYLQIYVLVSRLPVWLLESCDLERGEKEIAIFLSRRNHWKYYNIFLERDYNIFIWGQPWLLFSQAWQLKCNFKEQSCKELCRLFLDLLTLLKVASKW